MRSICLERSWTRFKRTIILKNDIMDPVDKKLVSGSGNHNINRPKKSKEYKLDYGKLEDDLHRELESDKRYWIQNDAKIRAVNNVGTYEDFRQIVLAAHLRPLDKKDKEALGPESAAMNKVIWNTSAACSKGADETVDTEKTLLLGPEKVPRRIEEFVIGWKKLGNDTDRKFLFLERLLVVATQDLCPLKQVFGNEVPVDILPNILEILERKLTDLDSMLLILKVLQIIAESKRFQFTKYFLASAEQKILTDMFGRMTKLATEGKMSTEGKNGSENETGGSNELTHLIDTVKGEYSNLRN